MRYISDTQSRNRSVAGEGGIDWRSTMEACGLTVVGKPSIRGVLGIHVDGVPDCLSRWSSHGYDPAVLDSPEHGKRKQSQEQG